MNDPLRVPCEVCNAAVWQLCTVPTETGRRMVLWYHLSRVDRSCE
jgi:hypothetical protein